MIAGTTLFILLFASFLSASEHPLKMSVANFTYLEEKKTYQLDIRLYIDDLIMATEGELPNAISVDWSTIAPGKAVVRSYLNEHLKISLNGTEHDLKFSKMKVEELTVYVIYNLKSEIIPSLIKTIDITDTVLVDEFVNQRNIVHIELPGKKRKSVLFNRYHRTGSAEY